ncbi:PEP-utilizing enzyme [Rhodococcus koreensis]
MKQWITDTPSSTRFPLYTRANADEVGPNPFPPLTWTLAWEQGAIPGTVDAWVNLGGFRREEFRDPVAEVYGCWGGYFYNQVSVGRVFGVRAPGAQPDDIDRTYFGSDPDVPRYVADPRDADDDRTEALAATINAALTQDRITYAGDFSDEARGWRSARPQLHTLTELELLAQARLACATYLRRAWDIYIQVTISASVGPGVTHAIATALGRPDAAVAAFTSLGDVESAETNRRVWELSRMVSRSPSLTAAFDAGPADLPKRMAADSDPDLDAFRISFDDFLADYGHRSPNEYDLASQSWDMRPEIVLEMIDRIRHQDDAQSPESRSSGGSSMREQAVAELTQLAASDADTVATLSAAISSGQRFFRMRESIKDALVRAVHEVRLPLVELGELLATRHALSSPLDIFYALDTELDDIVTGEAGLSAELRDRVDQFDDLRRRVPPPIVMNGTPIAPIDTWPLRADASTSTGSAPGTLLSGIGAAPGVAEGPARVVVDLAEVEDLDPGEILVCAVTDPSWTPLLMVAGAVVCQVGAEGSHAAVISRELGIPCVMSVRNVLQKIATGQQVRVNGATGTVEVLM